MLKSIICAIGAMLIFQGIAIAQDRSKETNDPFATKLLDKISKKYDSYSDLDIDFTLTIEVPSQKTDVQKGKVSQAKDSYLLAMDQQTILSDGKTNWIYLKKNNEVQILNADSKDDNGLVTPRQMLQMYKSGKYLYAITDKVSEKGIVLTQIEFKPLDKKSEYSKIRLSINEKTSQIHSVKAFAKDGGRYTFLVVKQTPNPKHPNSYYTFDKAQWPGARIEDLRM